MARNFAYGAYGPMKRQGTAGYRDLKRVSTDRVLIVFATDKTATTLCATQYTSITLFDILPVSIAAHWMTTVLAVATIITAIAVAVSVVVTTNGIPTLVEDQSDGLGRI
jgi:hypothetical protein